MDARGFRKTVGSLPVVGPMAKTLYRTLVSRNPEFRSSQQYWNDRYRYGGNSGAGSYGRLATFKAEILNKFIAHHGIQTIVEFGSGDGAQLELAQYPSYIGVDISSRAIALCQNKFAGDPSKRFVLAADPAARQLRAEAALSLDVIYHLVEDSVYHAYMVELTSAPDRFIAVYSSNLERPVRDAHVRHRRFTDWMQRHAPEWRLFQTVANPYREDPLQPSDTSWADFYFFERDLDARFSSAHERTPAFR